MKRIVSLILAFAMLIGMLPMTAWAAEPIASGVYDNNFTWELTEGVLTIYGEGEMAPCYSEAPWLPYSEEIKSVVFQDGITTIGEQSFTQCRSVEEISIPDSVTSIGQGAFAFCTSLKSLVFPEKLTTIGYSAFWDCENLAYVYFPESIEVIEHDAFYACSALNKVYYAGTESAWDSISIGDSNENVESVSIQFNTPVPEESKDPHEHSYVPTVTESDCDTAGFTTCSCDCGHSYTGNSVDALGHSWSEWYETKAATVDAEGEERRDCAGCDEYETRIVEKLVGSEKEEIGGSCGEKLTWEFNTDSGTLTITGSGEMIRYYSEEAPWYPYIQEITSVHIDEGVTNVSADAF